MIDFLSYEIKLFPLKSETLHKMCENTGFHWRLFSRIRTESKILSLCGKWKYHLIIAFAQNCHYKLLFQQNHGQNIWDSTTGKIRFLFLRGLLTILTKLSFWEEDLALSYNSVNLCLLKSFGNSWGNAHISCLLLIIKLPFPYDKNKISQNIK